MAVRIPKEKKSHRRRASSPGVMSPVGLPQNKVPSQPVPATPTDTPTDTPIPIAATAPSSVPSSLTIAEDGRREGGVEPPSSPSVSRVMETVQSTRRLLVASQLSEQQQVRWRRGRGWVWGGGRWGKEGLGGCGWVSVKFCLGDIPLLVQMLVTCCVCMIAWLCGSDLSRTNL